MRLAVPNPNRFLTVAFAAVAVALFADGAATASCGDYLTIAGSPSAAQMPAGEHSPKAPCHGPNCSANPIPHDLPLTVPLTKSLASERQRATVNGGWQPTSAALPVAWQLASECGTVSRPSVPFHPPKSV